MNDLLQWQVARRQESSAPLAARMRPRTLDDVVGQDHIIGPGRLLRRAIEADQLSSLIFYGPPGTGKTTLARVIAGTTSAHFIALNAVLAGVKNIREAIAEATSRRRDANQRTILFVDEVHRFNKAQQDALLPWVENGTVVLIGATTENPYFEVNKALVSRSRVFQLVSLNEEHLRQVVQRTLNDTERGYGGRSIHLHEDALDHLVRVSSGDARALLNALELAVETTPPSNGDTIVIDLAVAEESIQRRAVLYDKEGDAHFDTISAFIKSVRGSDADAALYWLAKMVYAGEDPRYVFRRLIILASEDVGLADPHAVSVVLSCAQAFDRIGMPEGRFPLAQATLYLATTNKSNSTMAFFDALNAVRNEPGDDVPNPLKDATRDKKSFGHGEGYLYPHAYRDHWVEQQYLPSTLQGRVFYNPSDQGYEGRIRQEVHRRREAQLEAMLDGSDASTDERLTWSPTERADRWLRRSAGSEHLARIRSLVFERAAPQRHHVVLDVRGGTGLLTWEAVRRVPEGMVWTLEANAERAAALEALATNKLSALRKPTIVIGDLDELDTRLSSQHPALRFDRIIGRGGLQTPAQQHRLARFARTWLAPNGRLVVWDVVPRRTQRLAHLRELDLSEDLRATLEAAEESIYTDGSEPMLAWDRDSVALEFPAGLVATLEEHDATHDLRVTPAVVTRWFEPSNDCTRPSYGDRLREVLGDEAVAAVARAVRTHLLHKTVPWSATGVLLVASAPS